MRRGWWWEGSLSLGKCVAGKASKIATCVARSMMLLFHSDTTASGFERDLRNLPPKSIDNTICRTSDTAGTYMKLATVP